MFVNEATIKKIASIHDDSRNHAALVAGAITRAQEQGNEPSRSLQQAFVRNAATAQITAAMLACIDAGIDLAEVKAVLNLDAIIEAENPDDALSDFLGIEHLDFETPEQGEQGEQDENGGDAEKE